MCTFHGDLTKFEDEFLSPAADIIDEAKKSCCTSETVSLIFLSKRECSLTPIRLKSENNKSNRGKYLVRNLTGTVTYEKDKLSLLV